ncbi:DUF4232 domain-containing protein [Promicromonospora sp. NPDC050249]|uniref:DUF4232 domain-containing protein n=1 Tax=Promicromonospora sp. NPDC050249 TaxID=3154743 RepID=UPI0033ED0C5E
MIERRTGTVRGIRWSRTVWGAAGVAALLATAGCSAAASDGADGSGSPSATTSSGPTATGSPSPAGASSDPGTTPDTSTPDASTPDPADGAAASPRCLTPDLAGSLEAVEGGASAGHYELAIVLENEASEPCVLQGWPGVSFVGDGDGTQVGAAATLDRSSPHGSVTLAPGASAHANLSVANAQNFDEDCEQTTADGLRVYPPGEKRSLFVRNDELTLLACANPDDELLDVQAFQPES